MWFTRTNFCRNNEGKLYREIQIKCYLSAKMRKNWYWWTTEQQELDNVNEENGHQENFETFLGVTGGNP